MIRRVIPVVVAMIAMLGVWETVVKLANLPEYLVPPPSAVISQTISDTPTLLPHITVTALEALGGFALGSAIGIALAVLFVQHRLLETSFYPYVIALKSVPIVAIAPLLVVWFGNGLFPKVIIAGLISFFPVVVNMVKGLRAIDDEAFDLLDSLSATRTQILLKLRLPASLPYLFSALRISATLAVVGAIVGEFAGANRGIGFYIVISARQLATTEMFSGILLAALLGIAMFYAVALAERTLVPWGAGVHSEVG